MLISRFAERSAAVLVGPGHVDAVVRFADDVLPLPAAGLIRR
jgi:hypothetical protein